MEEKTRRWIWAGTSAAIAVVLCIAGYSAFRIGWGRPFTFGELLERQALAEVYDSPQRLTMLGIADGGLLDFTSGKFDNYSPAARQEWFEHARHFDKELLAWNPAALTADDRLSYQILHWTYQRRQAQARYPWLGENGALYPVNQVDGIELALPQFLLAVHPIDNEKLARAYVARLWAMGGALDAAGRDTERQAKLGVVAPDFVIDESVYEMQALIAPAPDDNPLLRRLATRTHDIHMPEGERRDLLKGAIAALRYGVYPAYRRLIDVENKLRPRAAHDAGVWRLPNGDAYYADRLKTLTSTDMTADEINQYGLQEIDRIGGELDAVLRSIGLSRGTVGQRLAFVAGDPRFLYSNDEDGKAAMLQRYREILGRARAMLPRVFARVPGIALDVRRIPTFAQDGAPLGAYDPPSLDGTRAGIFFANLRDATPMWAMPALAYRYGIPGRHLESAAAIAATSLPLARRTADFPGYDEGWSLYAEHLAKEMKLTDNDPFGELGRLQAELLSAVDLVVDTGIHANHWSREQAMAFMQAYTGMAPAAVMAEVDRIVAEPGLACAGKLGMKTIMDLRGEAKDALGPRFDLKAFHAAILDDGPMPLWLLKRHVEAWIAEKQGLQR